MNLASHVINALFPDICSCCGKFLNDFFQEICSSCLDYGQNRFTLKKIDLEKSSKLTEKDPREYFLSNLYFLSYYEKYEKSVYRLAKFHNSKAVQNILLGIIINRLSSLLKSDDYCIIPSPSSKPVIAFLTRHICQKLHLDSSSVFFKSNTTENKHLNQSARFSHIEHSIKIKTGIEDLISSSRRILIFDDLWTTGATMNFMSKALVDAGISRDRIDGFVLFVRQKNNVKFREGKIIPK